jgi:hypothetical protein
MGNRLHVRDRKTVAEQRVRAMIAQREKLWRLDEEGELRVPLEQPFLWGYRREFVLRADVARRRDADRLLQVLALVQKTEDCKRKDFMVYDPRRRCWHAWRHTLWVLSIGQFQRLPEDLKGFFNPAWHFDLGWRYEVTHPWMFVSRRHKLYITHRLIPDAEVEQASDYLEARWLQNQLEGIARKCRSGSNNWKRRRRPLAREVQLRRIQQQELRAALEMHAAGQLDRERGREVIADA